MSDAIGTVLRDEQAGFWKQEGCTDQIFALHHIIEQCTEWQRQLYVNVVDFEKHLTVYAKTAYGIYYVTMVFHPN
jgi:hypothetical protein